MSGNSRYLLPAICMLYWSCNNQPYQQGALLYQNFCSNCHMDDGKGLVRNIPPLDSSHLLRNAPESIACIIRYGIKGKLDVNGKLYDEVMPPSPKLTDFEIANIINYMVTKWGDNTRFVRIDTIRQRLRNCN